MPNPRRQPYTWLINAALQVASIAPGVPPDAGAASCELIGRRGTLSQKEVAQIFGVTARQVRRWTRNKNYLTPHCGTSGRARGYPLEEVARIAAIVFRNGGDFVECAAEESKCKGFLEEVRKTVESEQGDFVLEGNGRRYVGLIRALAGCPICAGDDAITDFEKGVWREAAETCLRQICADSRALGQLATAFGAAMAMAASRQAYREATHPNSTGNHNENYT